MGKNEKTEEKPVETVESTADISAEEESAPEIDLQKKLEEAEERCNDYLKKYQRAAADFDNFRKRTIRERDGIAVSAAAGVIEQFLPVMDNLERASALIEKSEDDAMKQGFELLARQITEAFDKLGVTVIETVGCEFDPNLHNAAQHIEDENLGDGIIVEELQKGYIYKEKVIRHSTVKVAN